jgi:Putative DNA-binding domain
VSAFANFDGGHIIVGAKDPKQSTAIVPDGKLPLAKGKQGLKEWLETKIYRLSDPPVRTFDVKEFSLAGGSLAVIEIRTSDEAPHQDVETHLFYGRNGSLCYPLTTRQIKDVLQRQKALTLKIQGLRIEDGSSLGKKQRFLLCFDIENTSKVVCRTHLVSIRVPMKAGSSDVIIDDEHDPFNGVVSSYLDTKSQSPAYVLEIRGGKIYPGHSVRKALRIVPVHFQGPHKALSSRTEKILKITLFSDPPSEVEGQTQMTP